MHPYMTPLKNPHISRHRSPLQDKYNELKKRGGTGKAIVAVIRRMIELMYVLVKNKESYAF